VVEVLEYCEHHRDEPLPVADESQDEASNRKRTTDIGEWDQKFITVDQEMLFEIIRAAHSLNIKPLLFVYSCPSIPHTKLSPPRRDIGCKTVANMIKTRSPEEIRRLFHIVNDFTPEEEVRFITF
jgi:hypothetical protein